MGSGTTEHQLLSGDGRHSWAGTLRLLSLLLSRAAQRQTWDIHPPQASWRQSRPAYFDNQTSPSSSPAKRRTAGVFPYPLPLRTHFSRRQSQFSIASSGSNDRAQLGAPAVSQMRDQDA